MSSNTSFFLVPAQPKRPVRKYMCVRHAVDHLYPGADFRAELLRSSVKYRHAQRAFDRANEKWERKVAEYKARAAAMRPVAKLAAALERRTRRFRSSVKYRRAQLAFDRAKEKWKRMVAEYKVNGWVNE